MTSMKIEARVDGAVLRAVGEVGCFIHSKAVKNPLMEVIGAEIILFILTTPILFGLLCISIVCRELEARRSSGKDKA